MLSEKTLRNLFVYLKNTQDYCDILSTEEVEHLLLSVKSELEEVQIKNFFEHVKASLPGEDATDEEWDAFYSLEWTIAFKGKEIKMSNGAQPWQDIVEMLADYIDNYM